MAVKGSTGGGLLGKGGGLLGPSGSGTGNATRGPGGGLLGQGFGTLGGGFGLLGKGGGLLGGGFGTLGLTERTRRFMRRALSDAVDYVQTFDQAAKDIGAAQGIKVSSTGTSDADLADIRAQVAGLEVTGVSLKPQGTRLEKLKGVQQTAEAVDWDATVEPPPPPVDQQQATFLRLDPETGRPVVLAGGKELFTTFTIGSTAVAPGQTVLVTTVNGQNVMETPEQAKKRMQKGPVSQEPGKKDRPPTPLTTAPWLQRQYPVAVGFGGYLTDGVEQEIVLWSRDASSTITEDLENVVTYFDNTEDGQIVYVWFRKYDEIMLPIDGSAFVYCYYGRKWFGSYREGILTGYADYGGSMTGEEVFCAVVGAAGVRELAMPAQVLTAMQNAAPEYEWVAGSDWGTVFYQPGRFEPTEAADPISKRANARLRFDLGPDSGYPEVPGSTRKLIGCSAGIYQELMEISPVTPGTGLGACKIGDACTDEVRRFDVTHNPSAGSPTYWRNAAADVAIPLEALESGLSVYVEKQADLMMAAWDWGIPAYCRSIALDLGFTEGDLTP